MVNWNNGLSLNITIDGKTDSSEVMEQLLEFYESITKPKNIDDLKLTKDGDSIDSDFYMRLIFKFLVKFHCSFIGNYLYSNNFENC